MTDFNYIKTGYSKFTCCECKNEFQPTGNFWDFGRYIYPDMRKVESIKTICLPCYYSPKVYNKLIKRNKKNKSSYKLSFNYIDDCKKFMKER